MTAGRSTKARTYAGYHRPFSGAIRDLRQVIGRFPQPPFSINYFISGHKIPPDHWYRDPTEGTRVCGNMGHWIDLMRHILSWRSLPRRFGVTAAYSNEDEPDDNVAMTFVSELGDMITIMLSPRCEPFEGISETINLEYGDTIAKIDDLKHMVIWQFERKHTFSHWPKDVGHERAILQPFESGEGRDWHEVEHSTLLMLFVAGMVRRRERLAIFIFDDEWAKVAAAIGEVAPFEETRGLRVLEMGPSLGADHSRFAAVGANLYSIDLMEHLVKYLRRRLATFGLASNLSTSSDAGPMESGEAARHALIVT